MRTISRAVAFILSEVLVSNLILGGAVAQAQNGAAVVGKPTIAQFGVDRTVTPWQICHYAKDGRCHVVAMQDPNTGAITGSTQPLDNTGEMATNAMVQAQRVCQSFLRYGGVGDGNTPNDAAWAAATAALGSTGGCIHFPTGKYLFNSPQTYAPSVTSLNSLVIEGDGHDASILYWPNGGGISINVNNVHQTVGGRGLTISTGAPGNGVGLSLTSSTCLAGSTIMPSNFSDLSFRGDDFGAVDYWGNAVSVVGLSGDNWDGVSFLGSAGKGNGYSLTGNPTQCGASAGYAIWHNFDKSQFLNLSAHIILYDYWQGVTVEKTNFQGGNIGIYAAPGSVSTMLAQMSVHNSQFNTNGDQIQLNSPISGSSFIGDNFTIPANHNGIALLSLGGNDIYDTIEGNTFQGVPGAVGVNTAGSYQVIVNNTFDNMSVGINGGSGAGMLLSPNTYNGVTTHVQYNGAGTLGATCAAGAPSSAFAVVDGLVTHC